MKLNLQRELNILEENYYTQLEKHYSTSKIVRKRDNTFRLENWVITFPYNFYYFKNQNASIEIIRKLAVINSIFGQFYFREDNVLDEYQLPIKIYRDYLIEMCEARVFRNLAIGQLLYLCGNEIYDYVFEYEKKYYDAIIFEKISNNVTLDNMLEYDNLIFLGHKIMPLCITFAAFCLMEDTTEKIPLSEKLIINYHIAHQLYDDLIDISHDIKKPDLSYLLNAFMNYLNKDEVTQNDIRFVFENTHIRNRLCNVMKHYLSISKTYTKQLKFDLFLLKIKDLEYKIARDS